MGTRPTNADRRDDRSEEEEDDAFVSDMRSFRRKMKNSKRSAGSTQWIDGSESDLPAEEDDGPDSGHRKLSKAERKRLRKLKARDRAA